MATKPDNHIDEELKSILGEIPNWIFEYLELSEEIKKEWKYGNKASDFGGHNQFVQKFAQRIAEFYRNKIPLPPREANDLYPQDYVDGYVQAIDDITAQSQSTKQER